MTRDASAGCVIPFGQYRDLTVEQVWGLPGGDLYLRGLIRERSVPRWLKEAISAFLDVPSIEVEITL